MDRVSVRTPGGGLHQFEGELVSRVVREECLDERRSTVRTVSLYRVADGKFVLVLDTRMVMQGANHYLHFASLGDVAEYLGRDDGDLARELLAPAGAGPE